MFGRVALHVHSVCCVMSAKASAEPVDRFGRMSSFFTPCGGGVVVVVVVVVIGRDFLRGSLGFFQTEKK